jgi:hypothetical protein
MTAIILVFKKPEGGMTKPENRLKIP